MAGRAAGPLRAGGRRSRRLTGPVADLSLASLTGRCRPRAAPAGRGCRRAQPALGLAPWPVPCDRLPMLGQWWALPVRPGPERGPADEPDPARGLALADGAFDAECDGDGVPFDVAAAAMPAPPAPRLAAVTAVTASLRARRRLLADGMEPPFPGRVRAELPARLPGEPGGRLANGSQTLLNRIGERVQRRLRRTPDVSERRVSDPRFRYAAAATTRRGPATESKDRWQPTHPAVPAPPRRSGAAACCGSQRSRPP